MLVERLSVLKALIADNALKRFGVGVDIHMLILTLLLSESLVADVALKLFDA